MNTCKLGDRDVGDLHQHLIEDGYQIASNELVQALFGTTTLSAVRAFQASHVGQTGEALLEDGICGPQTWWALEHPSAHPVGGYTVPGWRYSASEARPELSNVIQFAVGEIGVKEDPDRTNRGPEIDKYGNHGQPWCAYFVSWAYGKMDAGSPFGIIASAYKLFDWGVSNRRSLGAKEEVLIGDIFVILRSSGRGHVGIVCAVLPDGRLCTVAGNESNAVRGNIRSRDSLSAIVRPVAL